MKKKFLIDYAFVQMPSNRMVLKDLASGTYTYVDKKLYPSPPYLAVSYPNMMYQLGGKVIFQGKCEVEDVVTNGVAPKRFFLARVEGQKALNNALLGGKVTQNPMLQTYFVIIGINGASASGA